MAEYRIASRDWTDIISGVVLVGFGLWFAWTAYDDYSMGSLRRMGPGFFPAVLGWLVAGFGAVLLMPALLRRGELPVPAMRPLGTIIAGGLAFAFLIEPFGLIPATLTMVGIVAFAEARVWLLRTVVLAIALSVMAVAVFSVGLGIPIPAFRWGQ
jgi:hypothetical protein